jgi:hypothetical protein
MVTNPHVDRSEAAAVQFAVELKTALCPAEHWYVV